MNNVTKLIHQYVPSEHREMPIALRLTFYRRIIGNLRSPNRRIQTMALYEAMMVSGVDRGSPDYQIKLLSDMLNEILGLQAATAEGMIGSAASHG